MLPDLYNSVLAIPRGRFLSFAMKHFTRPVPEGMTRHEAELYLKLDAARLPQHVAVIMDGNGRWASRRHLPRVAGHKAGVDAVRSIVETGARIHIPALTLYAFSTENWQRRPATEVSFLMRLLRYYLRHEVPTL